MADTELMWMLLQSLAEPVTGVYLCQLLDLPVCWHAHHGQLCQLPHHLQDHLHVHTQGVASGTPLVQQQEEEE